MQSDNRSALILGGSIGIGIIIAAFLMGSSLVRFKLLDRTVVVKGLSEREVAADTAVWPIQFSAANNSLAALYATMETNTRHVTEFLRAAGFPQSEITIAAPVVTDKLAQRYGGGGDIGLRYAAQQTVTVYTAQVDRVRATQSSLGGLGKLGIVVGGEDYGTRTQYLFTGLNELKPVMIEEATKNARAVAQKFAADSNSRLGKIRRASQGQFTIEDRDASTPHIKKVRVVSTVEYALAD